MTEQTSLASAIAKATLDVGAFATDKRNTEQNYGYISADAVLERGGQALAKVGVSVIPAVTSYEVRATQRQGKSDRLDVLVTFDMAVILGSETMHALWAGCGSDYSTPDKALYKAITSGHKYFLMKLLNISVGNTDSEHDDEDEKPALVKNVSQPTPAPVRVVEPPAAVDNVRNSNITPANGNGHEPAEKPVPVYTGSLATIGKHKYPQSWGLMLAAYKRVNSYEVDGILQKLALPQEMKPEHVVDAIQEYLDKKAQSA